MAKDSPYFQFPIAMFKDADNLTDLIRDIVRYSMWHYALRLHEKSPEQVMAYAVNYSPTPPEFDTENYHHHLVLAGANQLCVSVGSLAACVKECPKLHKQYGTSGTQCRIRNDYLWSANNNDWPLLKFKTLCAVLAGVGDNGIMQLDHRQIQALVAGYNSPKGLTKEDMPPKSNVRYWLDELWYKNMFQFCKRGWERWYSINLPGDAALQRAVNAIPVKVKKKTPLDANCI